MENNACRKRAVCAVCALGLCAGRESREVCAHRPPMLPAEKHQLQTRPMVPGRCPRSRVCQPVMGTAGCGAGGWEGRREEQRSHSFPAFQRYSHSLVLGYKSEELTHTVFSVWKYPLCVSSTSRV